jgi:hypothetical protein
MSKYFNYFPKTLYRPTDENSDFDVVTNLVSRFVIEESIKENSSTYYFYDISEEDTPEILAAKLYEDPEKHWIILSMNNILDPQWDWPLREEQFANYVNEKYSSSEYANNSIGRAGLQWSKENIHSYYYVTEDTFGDTITINKYEIDANTYANTTTSINTINLQDGNQVTKKVLKETKTYFDYEREINESKRRIKILKSSLVNEVDRKFREVMK